VTQRTEKSLCEKLCEKRPRHLGGGARTTNWVKRAESSEEGGNSKIVIHKKQKIIFNLALGMYYEYGRARREGLWTTFTTIRVSVIQRTNKRELKNKGQRNQDVT